MSASHGPCDQKCIVVASGPCPDNALITRCGSRGGNSKSTLLKDIRTTCFSGQLSDASIARGYLWYLMGSTLFVDKTRDVVPKNYVNVLGNLEYVPQYAWGAAALAYLYKQLGKASRIECWIYEYFPDLRKRGEATSFNPAHPRASYWNKTKKFNNSTRDLVHYRKLLDNYPSTNVTWTPYGRPSSIPAPSLFHGCIKFLDFVEGYMLRRVARQYGRVQPIPPPPIDLDLERSKFGASAERYKKVYGPTVAFWNEMQNHCYRLGDLGTFAVVKDSTMDEYPAWYANITHPRVHNTAHSENNVYVSGMSRSAHQMLGHVRQETHDLMNQTSVDPQCPPYMMPHLGSIAHHAGTATVPDPAYWGHQHAYPPEQFTQDIAPSWWWNGYE